MHNSGAVWKFYPALYNSVINSTKAGGNRKTKELVFTVCFTDSQAAEILSQSNMARIKQLERWHGCKVQLINLDDDRQFLKEPPVKPPYVIVDGIVPGEDFCVLRGSVNELFQEIVKTIDEAEDR
jgi:hypothetical protein